VTLDELDWWLDVYGRAWERRDVDAFVACFAEDAVYQWGPWSEPLRGHEEIRARTFQAVSQQDDVRFGHEPLAITPDGRGVARWWVSMQVPERGTTEEDEGIFLVTLGPDGRCTDFREWWNSRTTQEPGTTP
jgi:ketosteroid isomerase-like protein